MKKLSLLQLLLALQAILVLIYTVIVIQNYGVGIIENFTSNILSMTWAGQFNLDFLSYLILSGLWVMWRNKFSFSYILLGTLCMIIGIIIFAPYISYLLIKENGDLKKVLIGKQNDFAI